MVAFWARVKFFMCERVASFVGFNSAPTHANRILRMAKLVEIRTDVSGLQETS
jgi:hypothetical protein